MKKKKRKLKTWPIVTVFVIIVAAILLYVVKDVVTSFKGSGGKEVKIVNTIDQYGYVLDENDPKFVEEVFDKLRKELSNEIVDEKMYATYVSQIFLADFYSLNNAINKNDVGGIQYVYKSYQEDFKASAKDTIYRYVENNIYGTRKQNLPVVTDVTIDKIDQKSYNSDAKSDAKAFYVTATITYKEDLGYDKEVSLILVHNDHKLEVAVMK